MLELHKDLPALQLGNSKPKDNNLCSLHYGLDLTQIAENYLELEKNLPLNHSVYKTSDLKSLQETCKSLVDQVIPNQISLDENKIYYFRVRIDNATSLWSSWTEFDGQTIPEGVLKPNCAYNLQFKTESKPKSPYKDIYSPGPKPYLLEVSKDWGSTWEVVNKSLEEGETVIVDGIYHQNIDKQTVVKLTKHLLNKGVPGYANTNPWLTSNSSDLSKIGDSVVVNGDSYKCVDQFSLPKIGSTVRVKTSANNLHACTNSEDLPWNSLRKKQDRSEGMHSTFSDLYASGGPRESEPGKEIITGDTVESDEKPIEPKESNKSYIGLATLDTINKTLTKGLASSLGIPASVLGKSMVLTTSQIENIIKANTKTNTVINKSLFAKGDNGVCVDSTTTFKAR